MKYNFGTLFGPLVITLARKPTHPSSNPTDFNSDSKQKTRNFKTSLTHLPTTRTHPIRHGFSSCRKGKCGWGSSKWDSSAKWPKDSRTTHHPDFSSLPRFDCV